MADNRLRKHAQTNEDDFIYRRDRELIRALRKNSDREAALEELSATLGIADRELLRDLQQVGYEPRTGVLLPLTPLIQVAWSDGSVSGEERSRIFHIAAQKGVESDRAWGRLAEWLSTRPSEKFFRVTLRALRESHKALPREDRGRRECELLMQCLAVASSSGGLFGLGSKFSDDEESAITRIAGALEGEQSEA